MKNFDDPDAFDEELAITEESVRIQVDLPKILREHGKFYRAESQYSGHYPAGDAMLEAADEIERLRARVVELEGYQRDVNELWGGVHITDEMIDAAVEWANKAELSHSAKATMWLMLSEFHIFRCEGCGGSGVVLPDIFNRDYSHDCPDCAKFTGKGWVRHE